MTAGAYCFADITLMWPLRNQTYISGRFEKTHTTDTSTAKLDKGEKKKQTKITSMRNERGNITIDSADMKRNN